jgi:hypothetical protein
VCGKEGNHSNGNICDMEKDKVYISGNAHITLTSARCVCQCGRIEKYGLFQVIPFKNGLPDEAIERALEGGYRPASGL